MAVALFLALVLVLDQVIKPSNKMYMLLTVLQKGSVYALAAVSMNLLNGFTGLFSLGHAGFMLIGAYTYAIFSIPAASRDTVYQYYDAAIRISFPEVLGNALGGFGTVLGVVICVLLAGLMASLFAYLIGLPVLRLKSDYLAIATLGFAEIVRAIFQWGQAGACDQRLQPAEELYPYQQLQDRDLQHVHLCAGADRHGIHYPDRDAGELHLWPRVQGHPRRRGGGRGHGHQSGQAQDAVLRDQFPFSPACPARPWPWCCPSPRPTTTRWP